VFVSGSSQGTSSQFDYATVAYNATTGAQLWASRYNGPGNGGDIARSVVASATRAIVTGEADMAQSTGQSDYTTIAYKP
jgi:hypothetical protein